MSRLPSIALTAVLALGAGSALLATSCGDSGNTAGGTPTSGTGPTSGGGEGGGGSGGALGFGGGDSGRALFEATVEPGMMGECGTCHQLQGAADAPFLAAPDIYVSASTYPGIVVRSPGSSIILTRPADPAHGAGQAPNMSEDLRGKVLTWLEYESELIPESTQSNFYVTPFKPKLDGAFSTIYLNDIGPEFENVSITFNATELGNPPTMLLIENIELHPISDMEIHVVHPLFTSYPIDGGAVPDPSDSFSGLDEVYSAASNVVLGTGSVIHTDWTPGSFIGIGFENFEIVAGFFPPVPCNDLGAFQAAIPAAMAYCANTCHSGAASDQPLGLTISLQAQGAMDLSKLETDSAESCLQVRSRIKAGDPDTSQILIVTNPNDPSAHLYKFMGQSGPYNTFKTQVTPWILAEE